MAYKCSIFDFDGTLADTEQQVFQLYNDMAEKYKYRKVTHEELQHIKELNIADIMEIVDIPFYRLPRVLREGQRRLREEKDSIKAFKPHLRDFMRALESETEIRGILTSNVKKTVNAFLRNYAIADYFDFVVCSSLLSKEKKIKKVAKKYRLELSEILYIGDETRDIEACHRAGVDVVAVDWGYNTLAALERCNPTYTASSLEEILEIVRSQDDEGCSEAAI
ncbi:HAD-IA family hydrolase [Eubacterium aggregans]|uniref:HAD-IA family hydrolase n=1 Tax=Eubacterium aggregans TaxID=81409 RepID=UPI003F3FD7AD